MIVLKFTISLLFLQETVENSFYLFYFLSLIYFLLC